MDTESKKDPENPNTESDMHLEDDSDLENSDDDLKIDLNQTISPRKSNSPESLESNIIQTLEHEIGKQLNEKAEKINLTVTNVKTIIRQVLTNEHVRALIVRGETNDGDDLTSYEPKLTRAKAKELIISSNTSVSPVNIPWVPQPPPSETHVLIGEDLKEDDSGDEYVPGEEESEDDRDESIASESDISSLPPPTPPTLVSMEDQATQTTSFTDDGVFKIPLPKTTSEDTTNEAANIALRTRSKINLSSTPLEVIEKSFVPPDITTDMYDMECDDEEWREFLKGFTEPLEEAIKPTEDEEHDPEYNFLADDDKNQVDNEDFRMDKAVKISKKEVKELWEELFDYLHNISEEYEDQNTSQGILNTTDEQFSCSSFCQDQNDSVLSEKSHLDATLEEYSTGVHERDKNNFGGSTRKKNYTEPKNNSDANNLVITIAHEQICILEQQMRQHVQMLTQNFLLTYEHPEFHDYSVKFQEYLLNLKYLSEGKGFSVFRPVNLLPALNLANSWINIFTSNSQEVKKTKAHVQQELVKSIHYKMAGNWKYIVTFPKLVLETISKSDVFVYPSLLPKIPFKSEQFSSSRSSFTDAEDSLLAFGLDLFKKYLLEHKLSKTTLKETVAYVQEYIMPHRNKDIILKHINQSKHPRCATNPIQLYMLYDKVKPVVHYIYKLHQIVPPYKRLPQELPEQWKNFIYPGHNISYQNTLKNSPCQAVVPQIILINSPFLGTPFLSSPIPLILSSKNKGRRNNRESINNRKEKKASLIKKLNAQTYESTPKISRKYHLNQYSTVETTKNISGLTAIEFFLSIFLTPIPVQKLVRFLLNVQEINTTKPDSSSRVFIRITDCKNSGMLPNMPNIITPVKDNPENEVGESTVDDTIGSSTSTTNDSSVTDMAKSEAIAKPNLSSEHKKPETVTSSSINQEVKGEKYTKNLEFSTIVDTNFQQANNTSEVEFCINSSNIPICQTSQSDDMDKPSSSGYVTPDNGSERDNPEDINALLVASSTVKPNVRKELSGAEKKKNKLRKEFLANLSIATPEDPETEKHKNEMFAIAYYDKLRETLELQDYHKIMQILNDFDSGDIIDLYKSIQPILYPKYVELAEEFLYFLKEKEAAAVGQLIPWLEVQTRSKFLRKLEIYFKDQPTQLRKVYNCLMELSQSENLSMEKIKSALLPMLKGNTILVDLFLQSFRDERPPPSLLEGPYETIDINKELARSGSEERYETFVVPNTEDKYGGQNCICHCHKIEDNEYKSRYKHCKSCGLKFANGKPLLQSGRGLKPATVTFELNPEANHNARLMGKSSNPSSCHKKKRSDTSPSKQVNLGGKENLDEDTEDEEINKRKRHVSQKTPRKRKKTDQDTIKPSSPKKSPGRSNDSIDIQKDNIKPRKRTFSGKRSKKEDSKKTESETDKTEDTEVLGEKLMDEDVEIIAEIDESTHETSEEQQEKSIVDDCMDSSGESVEKPLTPGQQTAESESDIYLEESSQDNYESDDSSSSMESAKGSQSDNNTNDEPAWKRQEDTIILETLQKEDDKEYALQIISEKLPNRTISQIRSRLSRLMDLLIETLKNT